MTNPRVKARIEARILERVAYCVEFELNDPRASFITITKVEVSDDLGSARIYFSVLGTEGDKSRATHMLEDASGFVRKQVGRVLRTRRIPQLRWYYDESIERAARMNEAIGEALERDRSINPQAHAELPRPKGSQDADETEREYRAFLQAQEDEEQGQVDDAPDA